MVIEHSGSILQALFIGAPLGVCVCASVCFVVVVEGVVVVVVVVVPGVVAVFM